MRFGWKGFVTTTKFPEPRVMDLIECNKVSEEAAKHKDLGSR